MKRFLASFVLIFALLSQSVFANFPDVESDFHQETSINWLQKNGVVQGYSDGTFQPEKPVNRAEFLKMLYGSMGVESFDSNVKLPFSDVPSGEWYTKYVKQAYKDGVINGYPDGTFKPNNEINVVEALKIVDEAFLEVDLYYGDGSGFAYCPNGFLPFDQFLSEKNLDGSIIDQKAWYWKYMHVSGELCTFDFGLNAYGMAGFLFDSYMDRGDMAELLYRTKAVHDEYAENGNYKKFVKGMKPIDLLTFNEFDVSDLKVGMKIGDLVVKSFGPFAAELSDIANNNIKVVFEGETTVSGTYTDTSGEIGMGAGTCFSLDAKSSAALPHLTEDALGLNAWFCFDNIEFAQSKLGKSVTKDNVTIKITNYIYTRWDAGGSPFADLVEVISQ